MSDQVESSPVSYSPAAQARRAVFWIALAISAIAAVAAAVSPDAAGPAGLTLLVGLCGAGLLMLYAFAERETGLLWPGIGAGGRIGLDKDLVSAAAAFDAIRDPALIAGSGGVPRAANRAFRILARTAGVMNGPSAPLVDFDRLLGGHPLTAEAIFRLSKAAKRGQRRRESLPAIPVGPEGDLRAFDVEVAPLPWGEALWVAKPRGKADEVVEKAGDPLLDEAPIGYFSATPDGRILYMNETLRDWIGEQAERTDLRLKDLVGYEWTKVLARGGRAPVASAEVTFNARDGIETRAVIHTRWPQTDGRPTSRSVVFGVKGAPAPVGLALAPPAQSAPTGSMLEAMFDNAPIGVARLDSDDFLNAHISDANPALLRMTLGAAGPGNRFADIFRMDEDATARLTEASPTVSEPVELSFPPDAPGQGRRKEGREVHVYFAPDLGDRVAAFVIDVARYKEIERQFNRVSRAQSVGGLARVVAHDMNNYLNRINLAADTLLEAHPLGDPSFEHLQNVKRNVLRGGGLMRQLLAFSAQETTRAIPIDLSELLTGFDDLLRAGLSEKVKLKVVCARGVPIVKVDRGQLENVIMNLVTNARDAMESKGGGAITISTGVGTREELTERGVTDTSADSYAVIDVADEGVGMDEATLKRVFEPFFTTKPEGKGTGLGLATAFGVLSQANGHILIDSQVDVGTTFRLFLPSYAPNEAEIAELRAIADAREEAPSDQAGEGRILMVEDDDELRSLAANLLGKRGYDVEEARTGEEALEILEENSGKFVLLISDVVMPGMDGPTLLEEAREYLGEARVLFVSGYSEQNLSQTLARDRDVSFLPKPYSVHDLAERVKGLLGR